MPSLKLIRGLLLLSLVNGASLSAQTLVAGWDFNAGSAVASHGSGTLTLGTGIDVAAVAFAGTGTSVNAVSGDVAGTAMTFTRTVGNDTGMFTLQIATTGLAGPVLTYAVSNAVVDAASAFSGIDWSYSLDNSSYTAFGSGGAFTTTYTTQTLDFSSLGGTLANQDTVFLRGVLSGDAVAGAAAGVTLFDNIQITASAIPEPGVCAALIAVAALAVAGGRRSGKRHLFATEYNRAATLKSSGACA